MTKQDLYDKVSANIGISKSTVGKVCDEMIEEVKRSLVSGEKISLAGFGTFEIVETKARKGHKPRTGEPIDIPAGKKPRFRFSAPVKALVNR